MLLNGQKINALNIVPVVIPRTQGDIVFKCGPVDDSKFPIVKPTPPKRTYADGKIVFDYKDPKYVQQVYDWCSRKTEWEFLESISYTTGLTFETVNSDPATWKNVIQELLESGFTSYEVNRIEEGVREALGLNEQKVEEAFKRFLASQEATSKE
jgi:hypothetical protein